MNAPHSKVLCGFGSSAIVRAAPPASSQRTTTSLFALVRGSWYYDHVEELGWPPEWVEQVRANDVLTDFLPAYSIPALRVIP